MAVAGSGMAVTEMVPGATVDQPVGKRTYNQDARQFALQGWHNRNPRQMCHEQADLKILRLAFARDLA